MHQIKRKRGRRPGVSVWRQRSERRQERQSRDHSGVRRWCQGIAGPREMSKASEQKLLVAMNEWMKMVQLVMTVALDGNTYGWQDVMGWQTWRRSHGLGCGGGSGGCSGSGGGGRDREDGRCLSSSLAISPRCERKEKCRQKCAHVE
ncbi:hypothetical protein Pcinc_043467 [Petrolisthes cinctipes]|uniref:Uncharacterized protein n=1 Tax=Petrolisthes cinctipes TaxID=88211 RepID=A0AAE1EG28_PETCI|nr:hypothetical protein Pcinc_043467 [Petrolisthes cinctipes]